MRLAVVSDIHGNLGALEAVIRDFRSREVDAVVNLGDSLSGPLLPRETAQCLMAQNWLTIAGNHERQILTQGPGQWGPSDAYAHAQLTAPELAWIAAQPGTVQFSPEVFLCHGTPDSDLESLLETLEPSGQRSASAAEVETRLTVSAPVVLCGHTHVPRAVRSRSGQLLVNPGSVGLPALETTYPFRLMVQTGSPDAHYAILEQRAGNWIPSLITVPYDFRAMADLAKARNRPDWEQALLTGYMA
ncbi:MAG: metallophosphoesterase family protein [Holophaga sp.]|nr:metallophosphoesterase family protein [Holophaga sp.]